MDRTVIHVIRGSWIAWKGRGDDSILTAQIHRDLLETTGMDKFLGLWDHQPTTEEIERTGLLI